MSKTTQLRSLWVSPPLVTRGVQTQLGQHSQQEAPHTLTTPQAVGVQIDWLSASGSWSDFEAAQDVVRRSFPELPPPEQTPGQHGYAACWRFANGIQFHFTPEDVCGTAGIYLSIPGGALAPLTPNQQYGLMWNVRCAGLKPTRLDVALDAIYETEQDTLDRIYEGSRSLLAKDAVKANGRYVDDRHRSQPECVGFQRMEQVDRHKSGRCLGRTIYLGRRGKGGTGTFARIYDKGQETGTIEANRWIRFEMEVGKVGDRARRLLRVLTREPERWRWCALDFLLSTIDFREANGRRERARRKRCDWWERVRVGIGFSAERGIGYTRKIPNIDKTIAWMQKTVAPQLAELATILRRNGAFVETLGALADAMLHSDGVTSRRKAERMAYDVHQAIETQPGSIVAMLASALGARASPTA